MGIRRAVTHRHAKLEPQPNAPAAQRTHSSEEDLLLAVQWLHVHGSRSGISGRGGALLAAGTGSTMSTHTRGDATQGSSSRQYARAQTDTGDYHSRSWHTSHERLRDSFTREHALHVHCSRASCASSRLPQRTHTRALARGQRHRTHTIPQCPVAQSLHVLGVVVAFTLR